MAVPYFFDNFNQASSNVGSFADQASGGVSKFANELTQGFGTWKSTLDDKVNGLTGEIQTVDFDELHNVVDDLGQGLGQGFDQFGQSINSVGNNIKEFSTAVKDHKGSFISNIDNILAEKGWLPESLYPVGKVGLVIILGLLWPILFTLILWHLGGGSVIPVTSRMGDLAGKAMAAGPMITNFATTIWEHRADVIDVVAGRSMDLNSIASIMSDIDKAIRKYE